MKTRIRKTVIAVLTSSTLLFGLNVVLLLAGKKPLAIAVSISDGGGRYLGFFSRYDVRGHLDAEKGFVTDGFRAGIFGIPIIDFQNNNGE